MAWLSKLRSLSNSHQCTAQKYRSHFRVERLEDRLNPSGFTPTWDTLSYELSSCHCPFCAGLPEYMDNIPDEPNSSPGGANTGPLATGEDPFDLSTLPNANHTIYLDFNGHTTAGTAWNSNFNGGNSFVTPAYSIDNDYANFSDTEKANIIDIWRRVAEDFAPFNVNVTTKEPPTSDLIKANASDTRWGVRVVIGGSSSDWYTGGAGGVAYVGSFNWNNDTPTFVFPNNLSKNTKNIAEATSHEVGHTLGLRHDGRSSPSEEYYTGHGSGATGWAPIMGVGYSRQLVQWSKGDYLNPSNTEDDLSIITSQNGFGYVQDDHGNTNSTASLLTGGNTQLNGVGIISQNTDRDVFLFNAAGGNYDFTIGSPTQSYTNLDIRAELYNSSGTLLQTVNPATLLTANFSRTLTQGDYYLHILGTGYAGSGGSDVGYSNYGSLGHFRIQINGAFGDALDRSISGRVYEDWNNNGTSDASDPGVANQIVYLDLNNNGIQDNVQNTRTNSTSTPITDVSTTTSNLVINNISGTLDDIDVTINLTHTYLGDLEITLIAPDGTRVLLFNNRGGSNDNLQTTIFDDEATTPIASGTAPYNGRFRPEELLSILDGKAINGTWQLEIVDSGTGDTGTLNSWALTFSQLEQFDTTDSLGQYSFIGLPDGNYTVRNVLPTGWTRVAPSGGSYSVTLPVTGGATNRDFGVQRTASAIYGRVYDDQDDNRLMGSSEPGLTRTVYLDANDNWQFDQGVSTPSLQGLTLNIPDNTTVSSSINVTDISGPILDVNVNVNLTHTYVSDLTLTLIAPDGTEVRLFNRTGGSGDNFVNTVFDDEASNAIGSASAPFTGTFRPDQQLSALDGKSGNGTWRLQIADSASGDTGTLTAWGLAIQYGETSTPSDSLGNYRFDVNSGTYSVRVVPENDWYFSSPLSGGQSVTVTSTSQFNTNFGLTDTVPTQPAVVGTPSVNEGKAQRSRIATIDVAFNAEVVIRPGAFTLTRQSDNATISSGGASPQIMVTTQIVNNVTIATLDFVGQGVVEMGSLSDGVWQLRVNANLISNGGRLMASSYTTPWSGANRIHRLFGDSNGDGFVDAQDFSMFGSTYGLNSSGVGFLTYFDMNQDTFIDAQDFSEFGSRYGTNL